MENIDDVLLLDHLIDAADGTERSRTSSTGPVKKTEDRHNHSTSKIWKKKQKMKKTKNNLTLMV